ncbi:hypothetical protein NHX12_013331 [Muraenolepis orangiensis]|uniref:Fe2OG dioxygenase domain-containing protein n=1 Tax=Muraenolepis orangiensis TaxID=630683 RepID=A0A9Q0DH80_9TELE|nr:hypothetical protein NHX12_013331 [Muraenolepis orangiensis]
METSSAAIQGDEEVPGFLSEEECRVVVRLAQLKGLTDSQTWAPGHGEPEEPDPPLPVLTGDEVFGLLDLDQDGLLQRQEIVSHSHSHDGTWLSPDNLRQILTGLEVQQSGVLTLEEFRNVFPVFQHLAKQPSSTLRSHFQRRSKHTRLYQGPGSHHLLHTLRNRVTRLARLPSPLVELSEPLQVIRYERGGFSDAHHDSGPAHHDSGPAHHDSGPAHHTSGPAHHTSGPAHHDSGPTHHDSGPAHHTSGPAHHTSGPAHSETTCAHTRLAGNTSALTETQCRYLTLMLYLNAVGEGGETTFPVADNRTYEEEALVQDGTDLRDTRSTCERGNLRVKPTAGTALLWYNHLSDGRGWMGEVDEYSLHGACPVRRGEKWVAYSWVNVDPDHRRQARYQRLVSHGQGEAQPGPEERYRPLSHSQLHQDL